jgi:hypothetical protein
MRCLQNTTSNTIDNCQHAVISVTVCSRLLRLSCKQAAAAAANTLRNACRLLYLQIANCQSSYSGANHSLAAQTVLDKRHTLLLSTRNAQHTLGQEPYLTGLASARKEMLHSSIAATQRCLSNS